MNAEETLATVAHELRQPLAAIFAAIEIQKRSLSPERRQRSTEIIEQQVHHLARLVEDLSNACTISRGIALHVERIDAGCVLSRAIDIASPVFARRRHQFTAPQVIAPVWVCADATRLQQIFSNLLHNAAIHTAEGGYIHASLARVDGAMEFRVTDNGAGISANALDRIFDLFERAQQGPTVPGAGIGLSVVKMLVSLHGGTVSAHSDGLGAGSEFIVRLPMAD